MRRGLRRARDLGAIALTAIVLLATSISHGPTEDDCTGASGFDVEPVTFVLDASCGAGFVVFTRRAERCDLDVGGDAADVLPPGVAWVTPDGARIVIGDPWDECVAERVAPGRFALRCYHEVGGCGGGNFPECAGTLRRTSP